MSSEETVGPSQTHPKKNHHIRITRATLMQLNPHVWIFGKSRCNQSQQGPAVFRAELYLLMPVQYSALQTISSSHFVLFEVSTAGD